MSRLPLNVLLLFIASLTVCALAFGDAGDIDPSFDGDGKVVTDFGKSDFAKGMAIQQDGKIVVAGFDTESDPPRYYRDILLARYLPNGSLDSTFGGGRVKTDLGGGSDVAYGVAVQPDGKVVVAGGGYASLVAVVRYNNDASLDSTFDGDGKAVLSIGNYAFANAVALQQDGRIVLAGETSGASGTNSLLARLEPNGSLDASFGSGGVVITDFSGDDFTTSVAVEPDGKIVTAGIELPSRDLLLARFGVNGTLDPSFDGDGKLRVSLPCCAVRPRLALQPDGKIVVTAGSLVMRYTVEGSPDRGFGTEGRVDAQTIFVDVVAVQADGRIIVAGTPRDVAPSGLIVDRYERDGTPDGTFYSGLVEHPGVQRPIAAVSVQADRKIVVAGSAGPDIGHLDFVVVRLLNPAPETSRCRVPAVRGKKLAAARRSIRRARCSVGKITRRTSRRVKKGRVISQRPRAGRLLQAGAKVSLVVSRGRR